MMIICKTLDACARARVRVCGAHTQLESQYKCITEMKKKLMERKIGEKEYLVMLRNTNRDQRCLVILIA